MVAIDRRAPAGSLFLGGSWVAVEPDQLLATTDPATEEVIAQVAQADAGHVDAAVAAARRATPGWAARPWTERRDVLLELARRLRADAERLALIDTVDSGNPIAGSVQDVGAAADALEFVAGLAGAVCGSSLPSGEDSLAFTRRVPFGVVGRLLAYNHPLLFAVTALASPTVVGNSVVLKPADPTPLSALEVAKLAEDLFPPGVLSVLPGTGPQAGHALVAHPDVPRIAFTGSIPTGRTILRTAAEHIKTVTLELGGKNPLVVFPDADPDRAAQAAVRGMNLTRSNGQSCQSTSRVLVHDSVYDEVVDGIRGRVAGLTVGPPTDPANGMGPLVHRAHAERVLAYIRGAQDEGATLVTGGRRPDGAATDCYVLPTVLGDVTPEMTIAREEVFGPVLAVMRWSDYDDMLAVANGLPYALTANVWTRDVQTALRFSRDLVAGVVWINGPVPRPLGTPFGGLKQSGLGKESSLEELLSYTQEKSIVANMAAY